MPAGKNLNDKSGVDDPLSLFQDRLQPMKRMLCVRSKQLKKKRKKPKKPISSPVGENLLATTI